MTLGSSVISGCKRGLKAGMIRCGVLRLAHVFVERRVAILRYHSVREMSDQYAHAIGTGIIHTPECFSQQMEFVARKFNPVTLDDILSYLHGERELGRRPVAVTFDDGFRDNYDVAAPILNRYGLPATFYVTVEAIGAMRLPGFVVFGTHSAHTVHSEFRLPPEDRIFARDDPIAWRNGYLAASAACARKTGQAQQEMIQSIEEALDVDPLGSRELMMDWDQVRGLSQAGHIVGSHTLTHPNLAQITEAEAEHELSDSRRFLQTALARRSFISPTPTRYCNPTGLSVHPRSPGKRATCRR